MTTATSIITAAYRENNIVALVSTPNSNQQNEALNRLNAILASVTGSEAGREIVDVQIGGTYDQSAVCQTWVPDDVRLVLDLSAATSFNLDPTPYEGQRLAIADAGNNLATYNLTLSGNGRLIESATSVTLSANGTNRQWIYRADTGNWVKLTDLALSDSMPFPEEFDDYFITRLSLRLNPRNSVQTPQETLDALRRWESQLKARYRKKRRGTDPMLGLLHQQRGYYSETNAAFNTGRP